MSMKLLCVKNHKMWCAFRFVMNSLITKHRNESPVSSACFSPSVCKITKNNTLSQFFVCFVMQLILFNLKTYHIKETVLENFQIQDH